MKWYKGTNAPKKTGWYLRDYRNAHKVKPTAGNLAPFYVDRFLASTDGGYWYVVDVDGELEDAFYEALPWAKIKKPK